MVLDSVTHNLVADGKAPPSPSSEEQPASLLVCFLWRGQEMLLYFYDSLHCGYQGPHRPRSDRRVKTINEANSPFLPHNEVLDLGMFL